MLGLSGCSWAEWVETWKLPGTLFMRNLVFIRQPSPLLISTLIVSSMKPTSWRPKSSWISNPRTEYYFLVYNNFEYSFHLTVHLHLILKTEISRLTWILPPSISLLPRLLWTNSWLVTLGIMKPMNSERSKKIINMTQHIEIAAPVRVGCVRSFGTLR